MNINKIPRILGVYTLIVTFLCAFSSGVRAQTPGGINKTLGLWLSADKLQPALPAAGSDVATWIDLSPAGNNFVQNGTNLLPRIDYNGMNFHPAVEFYSDEDSDTSSSTAERTRKLVSQNVYPISATESYYTFWVSTIENDRSYSNAAVFSTNSYSNQNDYGWSTSSSGPVIRHSTRGTDYDYANSSATLYPYGIGGAIQPNVSGTAQQQYYNGLARTSSISGRTMNTTTTDKAMLGNTSLTTNDYFFGTVQEVIVYKDATTGSVMSSDDINKIFSYLAIKYGITLETSNYVNSVGNPVWTGSQNVGYASDIFGIAQDNASTLNQKQSQSTSNPIMAVFLGDLADMNVNNTSSGLGDGNYAMFGSNNTVGMTQVYYPVGTTFTDGVTTTVTTEDLNSVRKMQLKAQLTGVSSVTVNMAPNIGAIYIMVSSENDFDTSKTRLYKVEDGVAKDVVINDKDYIGFITYLEAPGGVADGLRMWLNAGNQSTITLNGAGEVTKWVDQSGYGVTYSKIVSGSTAPLYKVCDEQMNFHPAVNFRKQKEYLSTLKGPMEVSAPDRYTFFTALNNNFGASNRSYFASFGKVTRDYFPALGVRGDASAGRGRIYNRSGGGSIDGSKNLFNPGATTIVSHQLFKNSHFRFEFDGDYEDVTDSSAGRSAGLNGPGTLGVGGSSDSRNMIGVMGEMIAYERDLTQLEKNKIYSYLGLKYAITLDLNKSSSTTNFDYMLSNGVVVWPGTLSTLHQPFHNNVAGLVYDKDADLNNRQARSTDTGAVVHMGVGGSLGCDATDLTGLPNDKSAIIWGHDNTAIGQIVDFAGNTDICGEMDLKMSRVWMVHKTGVDKQAVLISPDGEDFPYKGSGYQIFLLVANDPDRVRNNDWDMVVPGTYVDGRHVLNYTFANEYTYFSFGVKFLPGACEACEFEGTKTLDFSTWTRGGLSQTFDRGDNFTVKVDASIASPGQWVSRYPRASSQRSLREYRRRDAKALMKTVISFTETSSPATKQAAAAKFDIFEIDYRSGKYDQVKVYGLCDGGEVPARLSYVMAASRSSYEIRGNTAYAKRRPTSSYTANRGKMHIEFDYPVQEVVIEHVTTGSASGNKRIGIGPMTFTCPKPLPPVNEDGLIFTKEGPTEVLVCQDVTYSFSVINTNCESKPVNFSDELEEGMVWVIDGLSLDETILNNATVNEYAGTTSLNIQNLVVPGSTTLTFRATSKFKDDAVAPKVYENQGVLEYKRIVNSVEVDADPLYSCDRLTTGCEKTKVLANPSPNSPKRVDVTSFDVNNSCYREDQIIKVTVTVNNPNSYEIENCFLDVSFNEEFTYVNNSLKATPTSWFGGATIDASMEGLLMIEGFKLPAGSNTFEFEVKSPVKANLVQATDENGTLLYDSNGDPEWISLDVDFEFSSETTDVCEDAIFTEAAGSKEIPYCSSKACIISNKNVTPRVKK